MIGRAQALSEPEQVPRGGGARRPRGAAAQKVLASALEQGGWFGEAHESLVLKAATTPDEDERLTAVRTLLAEETRLGMLVGVAVGWGARARARAVRKPDKRRRLEMEIRFLGHACFELVEGSTRVLIDPFLTGNPKAAAAADEVEPTAHLPHARP